MATNQEIIGQLRAARSLGAPRPASEQQTGESSSPVQMLKEVGAFGLGAVAAAGNFLDTPGSSVRDLLAGKGLKASFDQWLTPFSSENRTTGRELLSQFFGIRKNRETGISGWVSDPEEGVYDVGGFVAEILLDPFGPVAKPLNLAGKLATGVGKAGRFARAATQAVPGGSKVLGAIDAGTTFVRSKMDHLVASAKTAKMQRAISAAMPSLRRFEDDTMGHVVDTLSFIQEQGQAVDEPGFLGQVWRYLEGSEDARRDMLMDNDIFDTFDAAGNQIGSGWTVKGIQTTSDGRQIYTADTGGGALTDIDPTNGFVLRKTATDPSFQFLDPKFHPALERWKQGGELDMRLKDMMEDAAQRMPILEDATGLQYAHRQMSDFLKKAILDESGKIRVNLGQNGWSTEPEMFRDFIFKDTWGGTPAVNQVMKDSTWNETVDEIKADNDTYLTTMPETTGPMKMAPVFATTQHLNKFAEKIGMTPDELWEEIGFKLTKPYAPVADVEAALQKYRDTLQTKAAGGVGSVRPKSAPYGRTVFEHLGDGTTQAVRVDDAGTFSFTGVNMGSEMKHDLNDFNQLDDMVRWLESTGMPRVDAATKAIELRDSGRAVFSWEVDVGKWTGERRYFTPQLETTFNAGFRENLSKFRQTVEENPVHESEVIAKALSNKVREKYGHVVMKDMPYLNPDNRFEFMMPDGSRKAVAISDYTKSKAEAEQALAMGFIPGPDNFYMKVLTGQAKQVMSNRYDALGDLLQKRSNMRDIEVFSGNPFVLAGDMIKTRARAAFVDRRFRDMVRDTVKENSAIDPATGQLIPVASRTRSGLKSDVYHPSAADKYGENLESLLDARRGTLDRGLFLSKLKDELIADGMNFGKLSDQDIYRHLLDTTLDPKQYDDVASLWKFFDRSPDHDIEKLIDNANTVMKGNLLATTSTVTRNIMSGVVNSILTGDITLFKQGFASLRDGIKLASGKVVQDIPLTPDLEAFMKVAGRNPADPAERSAAFVARFIGAMNKTTAHVSLESTDFASLLKSGSGQNVVDVLPKDLSARNAIHGLNEFWKSQSIWQHFNPMNIPGVLKKENEAWVARSTSNMPAFLTSTMNSYGDNAVRMSSVLNRMRRGESFDDAFANVQWHQVSYDPRSYTGFERRVLKRLFPFYSFMSRSLAMTAMELATKPGGGLGMALRAQRIGMGSGNEFVPTDVQDTAAIALEPGKEGQLRYLTNLGLMHEDALRYLAPTQGIRGIGQQLLGSMHPVLKAAVEYSTNTSTFFEGPMGGRRLDDLDPKLGRIVFNIRKMAADAGIGSQPTLEASGRPAPIGGTLTESLAANSPLASYLRYLHLAVDPRRSNADKALNMLTGLRTREYSNEAMTREIRDRLNAIEVQLGARPMTTVIGSKKIIENLRAAGQEEEAQRMESIQAVLASLRKRSALADKPAK